MDKVQFFDKLSTLDDERLRTVLWTLYWRGSAVLRERIEAELSATPGQPRTKVAKDPIDPEWVLTEVNEFVGLARSGAYLAGDRRVSRQERARWRLTFKRLASDSQSALQDEDISAGVAAVEQIIDLACEMRDFEYFHSEDPVEAAGFVVSDSAALMWSTVRQRFGFAGFADRAAPQLVRWESRYGWTRTGWGRTSAKETTLAVVLARMLTAPDMWVQFTDRYLDALDAVEASTSSNTKAPRGSADRSRAGRSEALAGWHVLLLDRLIDSEAEDRLDRLAGHPALGGPELWFFQAQLAQRRGDGAAAAASVKKALAKLPGHPGFLSFAAEIAVL